MPYCTAADVRTALNIAGHTYDTQLTQLATAAGEWVDQHCNVLVGGFAPAADTTRQFLANAVNSNTLRLDRPLLTLTSLQNGDGTAISTGVVRLLPLNGTRKDLIAFVPSSSVVWTFTGDNVIQVTGRWGYSLTVPAPVKEATIMLASWLFKRYQAALQDATAVSELGELVYSAAVPKQVISMLAPYRMGSRLL